MTFQFTLLGNSVGLNLPQSMIAWGLLFLYLIVIYWRLSYWQRDPHRQQRSQAALFAFLFILVPVTTLFFILSPESFSNGEESLYTLSSFGYFLPVFCAVPWMLAAGVLIPMQSVVLGFVSGAILALFGTHSLFTPFEFAGSALIFSELIRSQYRGNTFKIIRSPFGAGAVTGLLWVALSLFNGILGGANNLAEMISGDLKSAVITAFGMTAVFAISGVVCQVASRMLKDLWVKPSFLLPVPDEKLITRRFLTGIGPFIFTLLILLLVGIWWTAGHSARLLVRERMAGSAEVAANSIPYFTNTGQNLILQIARTIPRSEDSEKDIQILLTSSLTNIPFFNELIYVDAAGRPVVTVPETDLSLYPAEQTGLQKAAQGLLYGKYISFTNSSANPVWVSFIAPVKGNQDNKGYLIGRTALGSNTTLQPVITLLNSFSGMGGEGYIIDEQGQVIYHPQAKYLQSTYPGELASDERFFTIQTTNGTPLMLYYKPSPDHDWAVVLALPAGEIQNETLKLAIPLVFMVLVVSGLVYLVMRSGLNSITHAVRQLTEEAERIQKGQLDHVQYVRGEDEIGRLGVAFEQMRLSVKDRVDELELLLQVSQGIATSLDIEEAIEPILTATMSNGASMARIVLVPDTSLDPINTEIERYGAGEMNKHYGYLDEQVLALTRNRDSITLNNLMRGRALRLNSEALNPSALISVPLRYQGIFLGILWAGYDQPRGFTQEETQFLTNLADDVSRSLANIRLYRTAELGKQRLEAILNSTPDPTFVIDKAHRIIMANPPAVELFEAGEFFVEGKSVDEAIRNPVLKLLIQKGETNQEVRLQNNKVFYAYQSDMMIDGQFTGRMCILRDISYFKEVDTMKSEFVSMVSHDLRAPLALLRGNATMLTMVGELNEQQKNYTKKILGGIETMSSMVNNLLDMDRIQAGMALQIAPVKAITIVKKVMGNLNSQAVQKNIQLLLDVEDGFDPEVNADQALIERALYNLVENGIKYTPVGGTVRLGIADHGEKVLFTVKDTGMGIAPLDIPKLFDRSFRSSQREGFFQRGSSLGLAIVKSIIDRHGGKVWVDSQLGKGSTFSFELAAVEVQAESEAEDDTNSGKA